jgi:hypothetical protein
LKKLRRQNKKLRRMSNISSLDSDTKVFNEIWNAVKQDKFDSQNSTHIKGDSLSSDAQIFNVLQKNKSLSKSDSSNSNKTQVFKPTHATIHEFAESYPGSTVSSVASFDLPENPEASPVYYPASEPQIPPDFHQKSQDSDGNIVSEAQGKLSKSQEANVDELREKCSSRTEPCHCRCDVISVFHLSFLLICCAYVHPPCRRIAKCEFLIFLNYLLNNQKDILTTRFEVRSFAIGNLLTQWICCLRRTIKY